MPLGLTHYTPEALLSQKLALADEALNPIRFYGDLVIAAFFSEPNDKHRKAQLDELAEQLKSYLTNAHKLELRKPLDEVKRVLLEGETPVHPFHWEIEFPEVFDRENSGFDAFVGNPPFVGGRMIREAQGASYFDWLTTTYEQASGNADIVAYFYRIAFDMLRTGGTFGLIATNTIGQGDTRSTGLRWICTHKGVIYEAVRRRKWPGQAAVTISVVHVVKDMQPVTVILDGRAVPFVTAYLFHAGGHDDPAKLKANAGKSFQGSIVLGMGFTFDDTDSKGVASPLSEMQRVITESPRSAERIFPYIGGEEVNDTPRHSHHRFVINFGDMSEEEARCWPELMKIVEERVKPERTKRKPNGEFALRSPLPQKWWIYADKRPALYETISGLQRVIAIVCSATPHMGFTFLPTSMVYAHSLVIVANESYSKFCCLQAQTHEVWARFFGSSFEDRLRYTNSDCFDTFPFPDNFTNDLNLETAGRTYYEFRAHVMVRNSEGLTKTYNRFQDPDERSPDILKLRELHSAMDRAVLDAYGWTDLKPTCDFILDYEEDEDEDEAGGGRRRKKPWRYRWPDEFRDEVLARLLDLNRQRAEQERLTGGDDDKPKDKKPRKPPKQPTNPGQQALF